MNRLDTERQRLYPPPAPDGGVRTLVLALAAPADWEALGRVWRAVQTELGLPAPGIAVSGTDALQLWFSLQAPVPAARAAGFLAGLRTRYLGDIAAARVRTMPSAGGPAWQALPVPAAQGEDGPWSAFIAADLAPVFADTPWLDVAPGVDGQADLLARLQPIAPAAFDTALHALAPAPAAVPAAAPPAIDTHAAQDLDPRRFLQQVLNDETVALALRIEAAKALLRQP